MKTFKKWSLYVVTFVIVIITAAVAYISFALPNVGKAEELKIVYTPQRVAHGKYLAMHVAGCFDCHSNRDFSKFGGPVDTTTIGIGGLKFDKAIDFPGEVYVPNITPYHLKDWTDGELFRAITTGVKKDGSAIFPIMPWESFGKMDKEDVYDIIAFVRSVKPQKSDYSERKLDFPLNLIVNTMPHPAALAPKPAESDTLKYGEYLVNAGACTDCHTKSEQGKPLPGMFLAGGQQFGLPTGKVRSANITTDKATGIGNWTKEQFIARFKQFADSTYRPVPVNKGDFNTVMPWFTFSKMKTTDLAAIYTYLRTVKPVSNKVEKFTAM